jgi:hypothetical protein
VAWSVLKGQLAGVIVAGSRCASPGVCLRWLPVWLPNLLSFANGPGAARTISDETYQSAEPPTAFKYAWAKQAMVVRLRHTDPSRDHRLLGLPAVRPGLIATSG